MSLFQFYSYIEGSLYVSGPQAHLQKNSHSCSHNHWFSIRTVLVACSVCIQNTRAERYGYWTNGCGNSCVNSPEDGPVGPKHVEIRRYMNKIVTSVGFHSICWKDARYKKLKISSLNRHDLYTKIEVFWNTMPRRLANSKPGFQRIIVPPTSRSSNPKQTGLPETWIASNGRWRYNDLSKRL